MHLSRINRRDWLRIGFAGVILPGLRIGRAVGDDSKPPGRIFLVGSPGDNGGNGRTKQAIHAFDPETGESTLVLDGCEGRMRISPDGKRVAYPKDRAIWIRAIEDEAAEPVKVLDLDEKITDHLPVWSNDGKRLLISLGTIDQAADGWRFHTFLVNADGSDPKEIEIPNEDTVADWSRDGNRLLTASSREAKVGWQLYVMKPDGAETRQVTEGGNPFYARLAPDGKRFLYTDGTTEERRGVWTSDFDGKDRRKVLSTGSREIVSACYSPDGKRIAVVIRDFPDNAQAEAHARLVVLDADGENRREFPLPAGDWNDMPDWR